MLSIWESHKYSNKLWIYNNIAINSAHWYMMGNKVKFKSTGGPGHIILIKYHANGNLQTNGSESRGVENEHDRAVAPWHHSVIEGPFPNREIETLNSHTLCSANKLNEVLWKLRILGA